MALHSQALPEKLQQTLKTGFKIGQLFEKWDAQYIIKPETATFTFEGETIEDLFSSCKQQKWSNLHSYSENMVFDVVCSWIIVNDCESFLELVDSQSKPLIYLLEKKADFIETFISAQCELEPHILQSYELLQKLFDDLFDKNFDHEGLWISCLKRAFIKEDLRRIEYLIDALQLIETKSDKDKIIEKTNKFTLRAYPKVYLKVHQPNISELNFRDSWEMDYINYMISNGYLMSNDDMISLLNCAKTSNMPEINELFLKNLCFANLTQEFIDRCLIVSISRSNTEIFEYLLDNHNPNLLGNVDYSHNYRSESFYRPCYIVALILAHKNDMAVTLMNRTDLSDVDVREIIRAIIVAFNKDSASKFAEIFIPDQELASYCLNQIFEIANRSENMFIVSRELISFAYKFGCTIDEEYLHKIFLHLDSKALDLILSNLNLTLEDIPANLISNIIDSHLEFYRGRIRKIEAQILEYKQQQYILSEFKSNIELIYREHKNPLVIITEIAKINDYSYLYLTTKINHGLFEKFNALQQDQTDIIEQVSKTIDKFFTVVKKCYDHKIINKNDGRVPKPIIWEENDKN
jgi:hypothetical protein